MQAFAFALAIGLGGFALVAPIIPDAGDLSEGGTAPQTLVAQRSATYESEVLTNLERDESASQVAPVLPDAPDPAIVERQSQQLVRLLDQVARVRQTGSGQQQLDELNKLDVAAPLSPAGRIAILSLTPIEFATMRQTSNSARRAVMAGRIREQPEGGAVAGGVPITGQAINDYMASQAVRDLALNSTQASALQDLLRASVAPNVRVDDAKTERARQAARDAVEPQMQTYTRGQVIAGQGARLGAAEIEALRETGYLHDGFDGYRLAAAAMLAAGFGLLLGLFAYLLQPFSTAPVRRMLVTGAAILAALAAVRAGLPVVLPDQERLYLAYAIPVAVAAMVTVSFAELPFAAVVAILVGLFAAIVGASATDIAGADFTGSLEAFELAMAYVVTGLVGAVTLHRADRLARFALSALSVALALAAVLGAFWLVSEPRDTGQLGWIALAAGTNGLLSAVVTVGCFVVLSLAFGVTTRLQLMELSQADHPLMRRLQDEAPGT
ncbi:MAG: hypothetical protein ACRDHY_11160, partial [Anaerolineales bacterium]